MRCLHVLILFHKTKILLVPQVLDPQFGMYVWPCALVLAQYLWMHRDELRGKKMLEVSRSTHSDSHMWR